jgi:hypothetical protein
MLTVDRLCTIGNRVIITDTGWELAARADPISKAKNTRKNLGKKWEDPVKKFRKKHEKLSQSNRRRPVCEKTRIKISIRNYLANGKTLEEATKLVENRNNRPKANRSKSQAMKDYYQNLDNRRKKAEQSRKLDKHIDISSIKNDYDLGLKPYQIMEKYNLTKNRYDHLRAYYLKK